MARPDGLSPEDLSRYTLRELAWVFFGKYGRHAKVWELFAFANGRRNF